MQVVDYELPWYGHVALFALRLALTPVLLVGDWRRRRARRRVGVIVRRGVARRPN